MPLSHVTSLPNAGRSCSKICLVKVYPAGQPDQAIRLYAIYDEQSNRSLVRSKFFIPELDPNAHILMLFGQDIVRVHKIHQQISGSSNAPFAQKLDLGWVIVGNVCLGDVHQTTTVNAFCTNTTQRG